MCTNLTAMRRDLLRWQWSDYADKHGNRANLLLHLFVVPLFQLASVALVAAVALRSAVLAGGAVAAILISLVAQGRGHKLEQSAPAPFAGVLDFPSRFLAEQWVTFPRYVLSGGWYRSFVRAARS